MDMVAFESGIRKMQEIAGELEGGQAFIDVLEVQIELAKGLPIDSGFSPNALYTNYTELSDSILYSVYERNERNALLLGVDHFVGRQMVNIAAGSLAELIRRDLL